MKNRYKYKQKPDMKNWESNVGTAPVNCNQQQTQ